MKYVHHGAEKEEVKEVEAANDHSGFRLWSSGPNFDTDLPQDVSGVVGQTAYLTCRVFDRTNSTVSKNIQKYVLNLTLFQSTHLDIRAKSDCKIAAGCHVLNVIGSLVLIDGLNASPNLWRGIHCFVQ